MTEHAEQRRKAANSSRSQQPIWTSARCNRLLRPLAAKVAAFRRSLLIEQPFEPILNSFLESTTFDRRNERQPGSDNDDDENWPSQLAHPKVRRTYRTRTRTLRSTPVGTSPGSRVTDISLPTPILHRAGTRAEQLVQTPINGNKWDEMGGPRRRAPKSATKIESLCRVFDTTLQTTCEASRVDDSPEKLHRRRIGTSTLTDTCLRNISKHIAEEASFRKRLNMDDKSDVATETFTLLEEFDAMNGSAHSSVRKAVRSEAVRMICDLVEDENVTSPMAYALLTVCTQQRANDEAELILHRFIDSRSALGQPVYTDDGFGDSAAPHMGLLLEFGEVTGRQGFAFRTVRSLIATKRMHLAWLGTAAMRGIWNDAIRSIGSADSQHADALALVQTAFEASAGVNSLVSDVHCAESSHGDASQWFLDDPFGWSTSTFEDGMEDLYAALNKTISSLCTLICALVYLRLDAGHTLSTLSHKLPALRPLQLAALTIQRSYSSASFSRRAKDSGAAVPATIIMLANLLVSCNSTDTSSPPQAALSTLISTFRLAAQGVSYDAEMYDTLSHLLTSIASCCGRASDMIEDDAFGYFSAVLRSFEKQIKAQGEYSDVLDGIRSTSYREFWGLHGDQSVPVPSSSPNALQARHSVSSINDVGFPKRVQLSTPASRPAKWNHGFRWEEGLCEWIAVTPGNDLRTSPQKVQSSPCKRRRRSAMNESAPMSPTSSNASSGASGTFSDPAYAEMDSSCTTNSLSSWRGLPPHLATRSARIQQSYSDDEDELSLVTPSKIAELLRTECRVVLPGLTSCLPQVGRKRKLDVSTRQGKKVKRC